MILYHFTGHANLPGIMESGLTKGEVPLSDTRTLNAVNLTTDRDPTGHGLDQGGQEISAEDSARMFLILGQHIPPGTRLMNKRAVRITVKIPSSDRNLKDWLPWARKHLKAAYLERLVAAGSGGMKKARTWKLYFGVIPPSAFTAIDILQPDDAA